MTRLSLLPAGSRARVVMLGPQLRERSGRLASLGLAPGGELRLLQKLPAFIVLADETRLAVDGEVAREIFVQRIS